MAKRKQPFEAVLVMFGANDGQDTKVGDKQLKFGTGSWNAMYSKRVGDVMDFYLKKAGLLGRHAAHGHRLVQHAHGALNAIYKAEAAKRAPGSSTSTRGRPWTRRRRPIRRSSARTTAST